MKSLSNRAFLFSQLATIIIVSILLTSILGSFLLQPSSPFFATQTCVILALICFVLPLGLLSTIKAKWYFYTPFIEMVIYILTVAFIYTQNDYALFTLLFFLGSIISIRTASKYYIFMTEINHNELIAINAFDQFLIIFSTIVGMIMGGILTYYHYFTTIIFVVIALAVLSWINHFGSGKRHIRTTKSDLSLNWFKDIKESIKYLETKWDVFLCVLGISWILVIFTLFSTEFIFTINDTKKLIAIFFFVIYLLGLSLGPLLCYRFLKQKIEATYVPVFTLAMTLFIVDLYFVIHPLMAEGLSELRSLKSSISWRIAIDLFLLGLCSGFATVPLNAIIQKRSDKTKTAEIITAKFAIQACVIIMTLIIIMELEYFDLAVTQFLFIIGIANLIVSLYICKLLPDIFFKTLIKTFLSIFYRVEIKGIENYEKAGEKTIIIANHTSYIDAMLFAAFLPDRLTFAINTYVAKRRWVRLFTRLVDTYPVNPLNPMAIKSLIEFIRKENKPIVIFPEGRVTVTGTLMKIYEGPGMIADKSGASLLPVRIQGAEFTIFSRLKGKLLIKWFPKITITILPPQYIDLPNGLKGRKRRQKIGLKLYDIMTNMLFESSNYHRTLFTALLDARELNGKKTIIMEDIEREPINYQQFIMRCFILGKIIAKKSKRGEIIGILLPNTNSNAITFFAMHAFSRVPAMLNFTTGIKNILVGCATAQIKLVYTARRFVDLAKLQELVEALTTNHIKVVYLEDLRQSVRFSDKLIGFALSKMPRFFYHRINSKSLLNANNSAVILFTSGSEGTPKAVVLSHANLIANCLQVGACIDFTSSDRLFNALPLFHAFGLSIGMILPLTWGIKVFFYPSPLHFRIVPELVYDSNSTVFFGTDTFLKGYAKYAHPYDFYCVRFVFAGAEPLREETKRIWSQKFGIRVLEGYGVTEASPVIAANSAMHNKSGTVGRILPGIKYQLRPVPDYPEGGVLIVSGPNIMKGYLRADRPGELIPPPEGWYDTGDVVKIDENGFVTIIGRMKRFAKIGGEMVSLTMVEQMIYQLWPEYQHAIVSLPDPKKGEQLILATTHPEANRDSIKIHFKQNQLSELFIPKKIIILKNLPLLGSGKLDYATLKTLVESKD